MSDEDPVALWRDQPREVAAVNVERAMSHRTLELYASTRAEIATSIGAAVLLAAVIAWRLQPLRERISPYWLAAVAAWLAISIYRFRDRLWRKDQPRPDAMAATGLEFYRQELERRRDHLRSEWIWHGPMALSAVMLALLLTGRPFGGAERLTSVVPLLILLGAWIAYSVKRRWREAREVQREIDEIARLQQA